MSPSTSSALTVVPQPGQYPIRSCRRCVRLATRVSAGVAGSAINIRANDLASIGTDLNPRRAPNARAACPGRQPADEMLPTVGRRASERRGAGPSGRGSGGPHADAWWWSSSRGGWWRRSSGGATCASAGCGTRSPRACARARAARDPTGRPRGGPAAARRAAAGSRGTRVALAVRVADPRLEAAVAQVGAAGDGVYRYARPIPHRARRLVVRTLTPGSQLQ